MSDVPYGRRHRRLDEHEEESHRRRNQYGLILHPDNCPTLPLFAIIYYVTCSNRLPFLFERFLAGYHGSSTPSSEHRRLHHPVQLREQDRRN